VEKGEQAAVEEYNEVINDTTLPPTTKDILTEQRNNVQATLQNAKQFEAVLS